MKNQRKLKKLPIVFPAGDILTKYELYVRINDMETDIWLVSDKDINKVWRVTIWYDEVNLNCSIVCRDKINFEILDETKYNG